MNGMESPGRGQQTSKGPWMPKLQNVGGNRGGVNELPKVNENPNMRSTNLKLDPIETGNFVNPTGPPGIMTSQNAEQKVNQSAQFQKGMLTPIDAVKMHGGNPGGSNSPKMNKNKMNMSMYHHRNQEVSASQAHAPRRQNDQLSPLAAFEIERE